MREKARSAERWNETWFIPEAMKAFGRAVASLSAYRATSYKRTNRVSADVFSTCGLVLGDLAAAAGFIASVDLGDARTSGRRHRPARLRRLVERLVDAL